MDRRTRRAHRKRVAEEKLVQDHVRALRQREMLAEAVKQRPAHVARVLEAQACSTTHTYPFSAFHAECVGCV